ncbi:hypothetical protein GCM10022384_17930 [Streptomyces marokkonensis]|uniref:Uncharacterized protein n=1 Tax=Streptomyces marokkonensis TaxID=324855 RepID=A0ABP7PKI5_9ACTN
MASRNSGLRSPSPEGAVRVWVISVTFATVGVPKYRGRPQREGFFGIRLRYYAPTPLSTRRAAPAPTRTRTPPPASGP